MKKKTLFKKHGSDICRRSNYTTFHLKIRQDFYISGSNKTYIKSYQSRIITKSSKWYTYYWAFDDRWLACQNSHIDISPLMLMTGLIDIYALLPENVSFLECFQRSRIYFIRYFNNPAEIISNHFWGIFLENHKFLREIFLRRLRDFTE